MLETVDPSGHISLGKQFAGQQFSVHLREQGVVVLEPVSAAAVESPPVDDAPATLSVEDRRWALENRACIEAYNAWSEQRPTFSASVHAWRRAASGQP